MENGSELSRDNKEIAPIDRLEARSIGFKRGFFARPEPVEGRIVISPANIDSGIEFSRMNTRSCLKNSF